jgi:hypothetical protein
MKDWETAIMQWSNYKVATNGGQKAANSAIHKIIHYKKWNPNLHRKLSKKSTAWHSFYSTIKGVKANKLEKKKTLLLGMPLVGCCMHEIAACPKFLGSQAHLFSKS